MATNALLIGLAFSTLLVAAFGLAGQAFYPDEYHLAFWIVGISMIPTVFTVIAETILIAQERMVVSSAVNTVEASVRTAVWFVVVLQGADLALLFAVLLITRCASVVAYWGPVGIRAYIKPSRIGARAIGALLKMVPAFFGILLLQSGLHRIDFVLLSKMSTLEQTGLYSAPYKLIEGVLLLPSILTVVLFPILSRLFSEASAEGQNMARDVVRFGLGLGLPATILLALVARPVMTTLFGPEFGVAAPVLMLLALVPVTTLLAQTLGMVLQANHRQDLDFRSMAVAFTVYVVSLSLMIPAWGIVGAAAATVVTDLVLVAGRYLMCRKFAGLASMFGLATRPLGAAAIMLALGVSLYSVSIPLAATAGLAVYVVTAGFVKALTVGDFTTMRQRVLEQRAAA